MRGRRREMVLLWCVRTGCGGYDVGRFLQWVNGRKGMIGDRAMTAGQNGVINVSILYCTYPCSSS